MIRDILQKRRSIRSFQTREVDRDIIRRVLEAALLSPSSNDSQPWLFILVEDKVLLSKLAKSKPRGSDFLAGAAFGIVVCADTSRAAAWVEDASIAAMNIQIAAAEEGLGCCWIQIRGRTAPDGGLASDFIRNLLEIPSPYDVETIIAAGYPAGDKAPHTLDSLKWDMVRLNDFSIRF